MTDMPTCIFRRLGVDSGDLLEEKCAARRVGLFKPRLNCSKRLSLLIPEFLESLDPLRQINDQFLVHARIPHFLPDLRVLLLQPNNLLPDHLEHIILLAEDPAAQEACPGLLVHVAHTRVMH